MQIARRLESLPKTKASFIEPMELREGDHWIWEILCGGLSAVYVALDTGVWSRISNVLKRLGFRSGSFLAQLLSETSRACTIRVRRSSLWRLWRMIWARMLAYITGTVDQELLLRNEYLAAEKRILRAQIRSRLLLSDAEKATLAEIAHRLKRKALEELVAVAKPDTLLAWYRKLIANKLDGSKFRKSSGRPRVDEETERLVVRMATENPGWGFDRIVGAMTNLGHRLSDQTVGNILRRHDIPPAPRRKQTTTWNDFIRAHIAVLVDFFTVEVLTLRGLITYYVLFFIHLESRRICLAGVTRHPNHEWMEQMARNVTMEDSGFSNPSQVPAA